MGVAVPSEWRKPGASAPIEEEELRLSKCHYAHAVFAILKQEIKQDVSLSTKDEGEETDTKEFSEL